MTPLLLQVGFSPGGHRGLLRHLLDWIFLFHRIAELDLVSLEHMENVER